jgi:uncharacterized protein
VRIWIDLANSPHVHLFKPLVDDLRDGGHEVVLTARDHAQTLELARVHWPAIVPIGDKSPAGRVRKAAVLGDRALALRRFARQTRPDVALSHGSYAQIVAATLAGIPSVTMMDYEHQPANHLSFRLAKLVIVPNFFPDRALRRFGASTSKTIRYEGFKEELYLADFRVDPSVLETLDLHGRRVIAVMRPPPDGALYHRSANLRFDELLTLACGREDVSVVVLPRMEHQADHYGRFPGVIVPARAVDACSLLSVADLAIGAGGTMNRESALLGTPTYTVFAGRLAAADQELMRMGRMRDLRPPGSVPAFVKKIAANGGTAIWHRDEIVEIVERALVRAVR